MQCFQKVGPINIIDKSLPDVNEYYFPEVTCVDEMLAIWAMSFTQTCGMALLFCYPFLSPAWGSQLHRNQESENMAVSLSMQNHCLPSILTGIYSFHTLFFFFFFPAIPATAKCVIWRLALNVSATAQDNRSPSVWKIITAYVIFHIERLDIENINNHNTAF